MELKKLFLIFISTIFVNNFILSRFLGLCPFFGVSKRLDSAIGMGFAVTFVLTISAIIIYPITYGILIPLKLDAFLKTIVYILIIASFVQLIELFIKKMSPSLYHALGIYLPLITTNCAILGSALLIIEEKYNFIESIMFNFSSGLGFTLALIMMASIRNRLDFDNKVPKAFKDLPIAFITAGLMSLAMFGFLGIIK